MKLSEVLSVTPNQLKPRAVNKTGQEVVQSMTPKGAGKTKLKGLYADVHVNPEAQQEVTKIVRETKDLKQDAYYQYISKLARNDRIMKNPFFPKVYAVRVEKDNRNMYHWKADMEQLLPLDTLSAEELWRIGNSLFFNYPLYARDALARMKEIYPERMKDLDLYLKDIESPIHQDSEAPPMAATVHAFCLLRALSTVIDSKETATYIKDPNLRQAVVLMKSILKKNPEITTDIRHANVMVRRGRSIPQIVFTDPVSGGESTGTENERWYAQEDQN